MANRGTAARVRALEAELTTIDEGMTPAFPRLLPQLGEVLCAPNVGTYRLTAEPGPVRMIDLHARGNEALQMMQVVGGFVQQMPRGRLGYHPTQPEPSQRNRALLMSQLPQPNAEEQRALFDHLADNGFRDQLRVLVCDGPSLLAWVGGWGSEVFSAAQRARLQSLVGALRNRLRLERRLADGEVATAALDVALERLGRAAYVVRDDAICHANAAALARLDNSPRAVAQQVVEAARHRQAPGFEVVELGRGDGRSLALVIEEGPDRALGDRLSAAAARWELTPRQAQVLACLARGDANKTIAARLGCAVHTIEIHVSQILTKADVDSRAALVARLITI